MLHWWSVKTVMGHEHRHTGTHTWYDYVHPLVVYVVVECAWIAMHGRFNQTVY